MGPVSSNTLSFQESPQIRIFTRNTPIVDIDNYSIVLVVSTVSAIQNKIQVISGQFKFQHSFMQDIYIELCYYYYITDLILISKDKNGEQSRQQICPHGAYD